MSEILSNVSDEKKNTYDKEYIESIYIEYQTNNVNDDVSKQQLLDFLGSRNILLLAPGKTIVTHRDLILSYMKGSDPIIIGVNIVPNDYALDFLFMSNNKRFEKLMSSISYIPKLLLSSNIKNNTDVYPENSLFFNYNNLMIDDDILPDAAGPMILRLLNQLGIKKVTVAGLDGYSLSESNYADERLSIGETKESLESKNMSMKKQITDISKTMDIKFITPSYYLQVAKDTTKHANSEPVY